MTSARFDFAPLERMVDPDGHGSRLVAELLNVSWSTVQGYRARGLSDRQADRLAVRAGFHPAEVWGDEWRRSGMGPLDEMFVEGGWRQAWEWAENARSRAA